MGVLGDIIDGVGGLFGAGASMRQARIESDTAKRNTDMTNQANMNLAKYQYSNELEMWNKANQYNSPASQMERYKEAGLNPNLIYGQGSSGNSPNMLPRFQAPTLKYNYMPAENLPAMLSAFQDFRIKNAQVDNLREMRKTKLLENLKRENALYWDYGVNPDGSNAGSAFSNEAYKNRMNVSRMRLYESQSVVASRTLQDQINRIRLNNQQTLAKTRLTDTLQNYQSKNVEWYTGQAIAGMVSRLASSFGVSNLLRRPNKIIKEMNIDNYK